MLISQSNYAENPVTYRLDQVWDSRQNVKRNTTFKMIG